MTTYSDVMEHLRATARLVAEAAGPVTIRVGDPDKFFSYLRGAGVPLIDQNELAGPNAFFGSPVQTDQRLPADMAAIGDKLIMLPDPATGRPGWIIDTSLVEYFLGPLR